MEKYLQNQNYHDKAIRREPKDLNWIWICRAKKIAWAGKMSEGIILFSSSE